MSEQQNVELVKQAYGAFGRGDIPALLETVTEDIDWEGIYGAGDRIPHGGRRQGKEAVREFFRVLAETTEFQSFEPKEFLAQGDDVVVLGSYVSTAKKTGHKVDRDWAMHFRLQGGRIKVFREYTDSAAVIAAHHA